MMKRRSGKREDILLQCISQTCMDTTELYLIFHSSFQHYSIQDYLNQFEKTTYERFLNIFLKCLITIQLMQYDKNAITLQY